MLKVCKNNNIALARGDTFKVALFINQGTLLKPVRYNLNKHHNWEIYLGIMQPNQKFEYAELKFKFTEASAIVNQVGDLVIEIPSKMTENLDEGKYYYQIKMKYLRRRQEHVVSLTPKTSFYIID